MDNVWKYVVKINVKGDALPLFLFLHTMKYIEVMNAERDKLNKIVFSGSSCTAFDTNEMRYGNEFIYKGGFNYECTAWATYSAIKGI